MTSMKKKEDEEEGGKKREESIEFCLLNWVNKTYRRI